MTSPAKNGVLHVTTPEGMELSFTLAGPIARFLAIVIDTMLVIVAIGFLSSLLFFLTPMFSDLASGVAIFGGFAIWVLYGILLEWLMRGQTIGKRIMGIRVMDARGLNLQLDQAIIRNLVRVADQLPAFYLVGGLCAYLSPQFQRLGDIAAGTVVVRLASATNPDVSRVMGDRYNSFRRHPHLQARLRRAIAPEAGAAALTALRRRDELEPEERITLFRELAEYFRERAAFPEADTRGLSEEQYVRNAVDTIYNAEGRRA